MGSAGRAGSAGDPTDKVSQGLEVLRRRGAAVVEDLKYVKDLRCRTVPRLAVEVPSRTYPPMPLAAAVLLYRTASDHQPECQRSNCTSSAVRGTRIQRPSYYAACPPYPVQVLYK